MKLRSALLFGLVISLWVLVPAGASAKKNKYPALVNYPVKLHVAGGMTVTSTHDTLQDCAPGQSWTLEQRSDIELNGRTTLQVLFRKTVSSNGIRNPGGAVNANLLTGYSESNYCPPEDRVELEKPQCRTITGVGTANLAPDPRRKGPGKNAASIAIGRSGGPSQNLSCVDFGSEVSEIFSTPFGSVLYPLSTPYSSIVLPLELKAKAFLKLGKGKRLIRTVHVGGSCDGAVVYRGSHISKAAAGDCEVDGTFNILIKRLRR